ncbi:MAG: sugar transferase [Pirellulaceae bacterium]|nr:sugar transferase [Pirellulaceae bacterium]
MHPTQGESDVASASSVHISEAIFVSDQASIPDDIQSQRWRITEAVDAVFIVGERLFALSVLILAAPLMLLIAVLIRLDSSGPAIFKQQRIANLDRKRVRKYFSHAHAAFDGSPDELAALVPTFTLYKFRTYHHRSEQLAPERARFEFDAHKIDDVQLQIKDDPRITGVGKFLRRTSLDELPNFINILKGDMRLIGPRPEVIEMFRYYTYEQVQKFTVKPGLTGLAQVNGRGKLTFKETVNYDLSYVRHRSWKKDLSILLKTLKVVVLGDGSF